MIYSPSAPAPMSLRQGVIAFGLLLALALVLHFPHFGSHTGDPNFDFYLHYHWAKEYAQRFAEGWLYPRWTFLARYGLGEPIFVFYSPLYYLLTALLTLTGLGTWNAMHVVEVLSNAVFGYFIYLTCRHYTSNRLALVAAFAASANPFLVMLHYKFQGFAWASVGYAAHGMLLWSMFRPQAPFERINLWAAAALGIAVVGHTMSTLVMLISYSAAVFVAPAAWGGVSFAGLVRRLLAWAGTVALGLGLGAIYLLPALGSTSLINVGGWTGPHILQSFAWPTFSALLNGVQWFSFQWPLALPVLALVVVEGWFLFRLRAGAGHRLNPLMIRLFLVLGVSVFFASELSYPLWTFEWPLLRIQLPYRFLSVGFVMVIVIGAIGAQVAGNAGRPGWAAGLVRSVAAIGVLGVLVAAKATFLDGGPLPSTVIRDEYTFTQFAQWPRTANGGFTCTAAPADCEALPSSAGAFRGTSEYITRFTPAAWADYAIAGFEKACRSEGASCGPAQHVANTVTWRIEAQAETRVHLPVFYFPMWALELDGQPVPTDLDAANGLIQVSLPAGVHTVRLVWTETPLFARARWISIAALVVLIVLAVAGRVRGGARSGQE